MIAQRLRFTVTIVAILCALLIPLAASAQSSSTPSLIVKLVAGLSADQQAAVIARNGGTEISAISALRLHVIAVAASDLEAVRANYAADPQVVSVEDNKTRQSESIPADALYAAQWALPKIGWDSVFGSISPTGTAKVAVLDTGIDASHPDLAGKVAPGKSILDNSNGMTDPSGHGTWVAGIIAANTNTSEGIAGVAFDGVRVMPVTVLDANGLGQDSDVIAGVIWAADNGADVILMAFSNPGFSANLQDAIDYAWSKGVVLVASVGNSATADATFPAGDRGVMGVAATTPDDVQAYFSNQGKSVFIAAPGVNIQTTDTIGPYIEISGTSASAAIIAGVAGFMKAVDPSLSNGAIVGRIARNADAVGSQEQTGNGRVNMMRALQDTSLEEVQPVGADPVGDGGPFLGPYRADNITAATITILKSDCTAAPTGFVVGDTVCASVSVTRNAGSTNNEFHIRWLNPSGTQVDEAIFTNFPSAGTYTRSDTFAVNAAGTWTVVACRNNCLADNVLHTLTFVVSPPDSTPPVITPNVSGTLGTNGWYKSNVTVSWTVVDNESPITSTTGCDSTALSNETGGVTLTCSATSTGGTATESVTIKIDKTPPQIALQSRTSANANGWNKTNVTVNWTCADALSGVVSSSATQTVTSEGANQSATGVCTDLAGNTASDTQNGINIDKTGPVITFLNQSPAANSNGWNNTDVTLNWSCSDPGSGVVSSNVNQIVTGEGANQSGTGTCTDLAGNTTSDTRSGIKIDKTKPNASAVPSPGPNGNGWNNTNVIVSFEGTDSLSGIDLCTSPVTLSGEAAGQSASGTCTDKAGNVSPTATASNINIDKTNPTATATASPAPNANGWNNTNVTVTFQGLDSLSGIDFCTAPATLSGEGVGQSASGTCTDKAGNVSSAAMASNIKIDKTAPLVAVTGVEHGAHYVLGSVPTAGCSTTDALSGVGTYSSVSVTGGINGVGQFTATCSGGLDKAGNPQAAASATYNVEYNFSGFFRPVDNLPTTNVAKAGSAIPVKFSLSGFQGMNIFATGYPRVVTTTACMSNAPLDVIEETVPTATSNAFNYDAVADQYVFVWKTEKSWTGCRQLQILLIDGTVHAANFSFTK